MLPQHVDVRGRGSAVYACGGSAERGILQLVHESQRLADQVSAIRTPRIKNKMLFQRKNCVVPRSQRVARIFTFIRRFESGLCGVSHRRLLASIVHILRSPSCSIDAASEDRSSVLFPVGQCRAFVIDATYFQVHLM